MLDDEKEKLHGANYTQGRQASELIEWIDRYGYARAAGLASLTKLRRAERFAYKQNATEHHRRVQALLAIRAVEFVEAENPPRTSKRQGQFLQFTYNLLDDEKRAWCRDKLSLEAV